MEPTTTTTLQPPTSPLANDNDPDAELSELVEKFQKIQHSLPSAFKGPGSPETLQYVMTEIENLTRKQAMIQQQIEGKNKEIQTLRETLLVVSGALQGLQHIHKFMTKEGADASSSSTPAARAPAARAQASTTDA